MNENKKITFTVKGTDIAAVIFIILSFLTFLLCVGSPDIIDGIVFRLMHLQ